MDSEITDNLKDKIEVSVLAKIIEDLKNIEPPNNVGENEV
jgi:hypothetical protein